jgi:hypothetical protein
MLRPKNSYNFFSRALAASLACCLLLFLVQIVVHNHQNGGNDGACRVCHSAHFASLPGSAALLLTLPLLPQERLYVIASNFHQRLFANDSPSRAPPFPQAHR